MFQKYKYINLHLQSWDLVKHMLRDNIFELLGLLNTSKEFTNNITKDIYNIKYSSADTVSKATRVDVNFNNGILLEWLIFTLDIGY